MKKNGFKIKYDKFCKQEELKCPTRKRIKKENKLKETLEEKVFKHKSVLDIKIENAMSILREFF